MTDRETSGRRATAAATVVLLVLLVLLSAATARAQQSDKWYYAFTPYLWGTSLSGTVGLGDRSAGVDVGFRDLVTHLRMAGMARMEARRNRTSIVGDVMFVSVRADSGIAVGLRSAGTSFTQREWIVNLTAGYAVLDLPTATIDLMVGARYWNLDMGLGATTGTGASVDRSATRDWVDATLGVAGRMLIADRWRLGAQFDAGAGGSRNTYQFGAIVGYDFSERYSLATGYRYLDGDYRNNGFVNDTKMDGLILAFSFRFY